MDDFLFWFIFGIIVLICIVVAVVVGNIAYFVSQQSMGRDADEED